MCLTTSQMTTKILDFALKNITPNPFHACALGMIDKFFLT